MIAVRLWLGYIIEDADSGLTTNPAARIALPTVTVQPVPVIHDADLAALLRSMDGTSFVDRRDVVMVRLLLDTGCRRAELAGIDLADIDERAHEITLRRTKGGRARSVVFGSRTAVALRKYQRARQAHRRQLDGAVPVDPQRRRRELADQRRRDRGDAGAPAQGGRAPADQPARPRSHRRGTTGMSDPPSRSPRSLPPMAGVMCRYE